MIKNKKSILPEDAVLIRSKRKSLGIEIDRDARLIIRAPLKMSEKSIAEFLSRKEDWINKNKQKVKASIECAQDKLTNEELSSLKERAQGVFCARTAHFAEIMGVDFQKITIRAQRTKWGSCTSKGNLNFNCLLLLAPEKVLDYVVVHELCHRKYMNHSKAFRKELYSFFPDAPECERYLRTEGRILMQRLPEND